MTNHNMVILPIIPRIFSIRFRLTNVLLYGYIVLVFLLSGFLEMFTGGIYRQSIAIILTLILSIFYRLRIDQVFITALLLVGFIVLSAIHGGADLTDIILFLRGPIFVFVTYHVIVGWLRSHPLDVIKLWYTFFSIGVLQLPIVILQTIFWKQMVPYIQGGTHKIDAGFGTFPVKADYAMAFFLCMLIIVLLFRGEKLIGPKWRGFLLVWYTLTVLVANSQIMHIALGLVWMVYSLSHLRLKFMLWAGVGLILLSVVIGGLQQVGWMPLNLSVTFSTLQDQLQGKEGNYSRGAVIYKFLSQPIDWIGKGPGYYYNVVDRKVEGLDIHGHLLTYYAEVGLIGTLLSYLLLWFVAKPIYVTKISTRLKLLSISALSVILILSTTSHVLNQLSIVSIYILSLYWFGREDMDATSTQAI